MPSQKDFENKPYFPLWYRPVSVLGIPTVLAFVAAPIFTILKQKQNNAQLGTKIPNASLKGFLAITYHLIMRTILRIGPVPLAQEFAINHRPHCMTKDAAKTGATIATIVAGDMANTPMELMATKQQSHAASNKVPSFSGWWKDRRSTLQFVGKLYGFDHQLRGGAMLAVGLRSSPFVSTIILTQNEIRKRIKPEHFKQEVAITATTATVGMFANALLTPLSAIQQQTMRDANPKALKEAFESVLSNGIKHAYKGATTRFWLSGFSAVLTLSVLALQEALKASLEEKSASCHNGLR